MPINLVDKTQGEISGAWDAVWRKEIESLPEDFFDGATNLEGLDPSLVLAWNKNALYRRFFSRPLFQDGYLVLRKYITNDPEQKVLEIGAGSGRYSMKIAREFPGSEVWVTDISEESLKLTRILAEKFGFKNLKVQKEDACRLSFRDDYFDFIFCGGAMSCLPDPRAAIAEIKRVLKPGGRAVVTAVNSLNLLRPIFKIFEKDKIVRDYERSFTPDKLKYLLVSSGLGIIGEDGFYVAQPISELGKKSKFFKFLGRAVNRLVKIVDRRTGRFISRKFGFEILAVGEKEGGADKKASELKEIVNLVKRPVPAERDLKMVEIAILKYKDPEVETKCAQHIIENTNWPYKLTIYDNRLGTKNTSKIWNKLIKESTCDYILILDSDAFVPNISPCWLTRMMETFFMKNDCHVVVPRVTRTSCSQQRSDKAEEKEPEVLTENFAGQCVLYKKEIFEKVGYFDEDFLFYGQDTEWAQRTMKKGYKIYLRPDVLINHIGHYSIKKAAKNAEFNSKLEREYADAIFREKT